MADTTYKIPHDTLKKEISKPEDFTPPEELYKKLIATIRAYRPTTDLSEIEKAYKIASKAHEGQKRKSGNHILFTRFAWQSFWQNWNLIKRRS